MPQLLPRGSIAGQHDHIEAVLVADPTVLEDPPPGDALNGAALSVDDRFFASTAAIAAPRLDLDEGHQRTAPSNEVEIVATEPKAVSLNAPTGGDQKVTGGHFGLPAIAVATVSPFVGSFRGSLHAQMIATWGAMGGSMECRAARNNASPGRNQPTTAPGP